MDIIKGIVIGVAGRMGGRILWALRETSNIHLAGAVERKDHPALGRDVGEVAGMDKWGVPIVGDLRQAIDAGDVIIVPDREGDVPHRGHGLQRTGRDRQPAAALGSVDHA